MSSVNAANASNFDSFSVDEVTVRRAVQSHDPGILTDIYLEETDIAIWQRELSETLKKSVDAFLKSKPAFQATMIVTPQTVFSCVNESIGSTTQSELSENIAELVDMFCCLFELKRTGLRLGALDRAMCPKFHVDRVPCRLVTTYQGIATEWLPHQVVDRTKLGLGSNGLADNESGLYQQQDDIQRLGSGDVALLKGKHWEGNENAGLVHRSPALPERNHRLLLTLDFAD